MRNGPQTISLNRKEAKNKFFFITWGKNKETNEFSAELQAVWHPNNILSATKDKKLNISKNGSIDFKREYSLVSQMPKMSVYTVKR